jgi:hypothetical protein
MEKTYFEALIKLQDEIKNPVNSESGYNDRYRYVPLDKLLEDVKPILSKNKFVIKYFGTKDSVGAKLIHESGELEQSELRLPEFDDAQKLGSYITYSRRYQTLMLLGIMGKDEDDDGLVTTKTSEHSQVSTPDSPRTSRGPNNEQDTYKKIKSDYMGVDAYICAEGVYKGRSYYGWTAKDKTLGLPKYKTDEDFYKAKELAEIN